MRNRSRVYIGTFNVGEATVIVDLILDANGLMGLTGEGRYVLTHNGNITDASFQVDPTSIGEDLRPAANDCVALAIGQCALHGHHGTVNYVHEGLFARADLARVLAEINVAFTYNRAIPPPQGEARVH